MAYPYYPIGYNPYGVYPSGYQQMAQQPQIQQQMQSAQMPVANQAPATSGIIWVSGLAEAQAFPVVANSAVALWENSGKTIFLKSSDATGKPSLRIYDLVERKESSSASFGAVDEKAQDYASRNDVTAIAETVKGILGDIEQIKGDLYGMAGRKKSTKKEVTEDDA